MSTSFSMFSLLIDTYPSWDALKAHLTSAEGGKLRVDDNSTPESPFALIRYTKGISDLTLAHVRAFRSVVWDVVKNVPVSAMPFKSEDGEGLPTDETFSDSYVVESFVDGVGVGMFWDAYSHTWRIHTRSTLDATCRYFSQTKTFATMFAEATPDLDYGALIKEHNYNWVLQHPENRIVVPVTVPRAHLVSVGGVRPGGTYVEMVPYSESPITKKYGLTAFSGLSSWADVHAIVTGDNDKFKWRAQGVVVKHTPSGRRYKLRTAEYNRVRTLRGNTARLDFHWLTKWADNTLFDYIAVYPEERARINTLVDKWKRTTGDVFHIYTDVFKARSLDKSAIPPKYKPLVYGLHNLYVSGLKPAGKSVDWKATVEYMNGRDTAQKLFVLNWEVRQAAQQMGTPVIPVEPASVVETSTDA
jgi:hypothetical protein